MKFHYSQLNQIVDNIDRIVLNRSNSYVDDSCDIDLSQSYSSTNLKLQKEKIYKPSSKLNCCRYCKKIFRRRHQLDTHLNIHTGRKPHQCEACGRQFRAITTLQSHLSTHDCRQTFTCKFCDKEFTHRAALS